MSKSNNSNSFKSNLFSSPISAIYTPFSFILIYEVYLLVYYIPKSFSNYIIKQYEIISLIILRKLFKDLSIIDQNGGWDQFQDFHLPYQLITSLILFVVIYLFNIEIKKTIKINTKGKSINKFIKFKKIISSLLYPILFLLAVHTLISWFKDVFINFKIDNLNLDKLFFYEVFSILIVVDVLLLLISFFYTDKFHKIFRNSGFIISTILIRLSFGFQTPLSNILILSAVFFGLLILIIHNKYEANLNES
ncbi:MAG: hypothetical protein CM15mP23_02580 [Cryomorphaceae bacterium]|nr:MAG: hypothetical protein CM15mP23_02580 [Cryomorphaceae bacterium]